MIPGRAGDICRLTALVVAERVRGQGVGRQLVAEVEDYARNTGCVRVEVTSNAKRAKAHDFYQALGYTRLVRALGTRASQLGGQAGLASKPPVTD